VIPATSSAADPQPVSGRSSGLNGGRCTLFVGAGASVNGAERLSFARPNGRLRAWLGALLCVA
jgi:hypothetical protein